MANLPPAREALAVPNYKGVCKRDTKALDINTENWEEVAADRSKWRKESQAEGMHSSKALNKPHLHQMRPRLPFPHWNNQQ